MGMAEGVAARAVAVEILTGILGEGRMLEDVADLGLPPADRARALRLAETTLRHIAPVDKLLDRQLRKSPPLALRNVFRLAVV